MDTLIVPTDYGDGLGIEVTTTEVPVCRPRKSWWFRTHHDPRFQPRMRLLIDENENDTLYLVARPLWGRLADEPLCVTRLLVTSITRQGTLFLWPIKPPDDDGGALDSWSRSALESASIGQREWIRLLPNRQAGCYTVRKTKTIRVEPPWPDDMKMQELVRTAFRDRLITTIDHPIIRALFGEA